MLCSPSYMGKPCVDGNSRDSPNKSPLMALAMHLIYEHRYLHTGLPWWLSGVKITTAVQETQVQSLDQEDSLEKEIATHSSILALGFHGHRSLVGYSPWGRKESDRTSHFQISFPTH